MSDEIARLKREKGKPKIKPNCPPGEGDEDEDDGNNDDNDDRPQPNHKPKPDTGSEQSVPRNEQIKVDREEVVPLDRSQLPPDVKHRGYRGERMAMCQ